MRLIIMPNISRNHSVFKIIHEGRVGGMKKRKKEKEGR